MDRFLVLSIVLLFWNILCGSSIILSREAPALYPQVVIVGGGPAGLVSALTFQDLDWKNIVILEKRSKDSYRSESTYTYGIDGRGQKIFKALNLTRIISRYGVQIRNGTNFVEVKHDGAVLQQTVRIQEAERYYVLRNILLKLLLDEIEHRNSLRRNNGGFSIEVLYDCDVRSITTLENGKLAISYKHNHDDNKSIHPAHELELQADLILGCDGIHSVCRSFLAKNWEITRENQNNIYKKLSLFKPRNPFQPIRMPSNSGGLKFKFFPIKNATAVEYMLINDYSNGSRLYNFTQGHVFTFRGKDTRDEVFIFPIHNELRFYATAGVIRRESDPIWNCLPSEILHHLSKTIPQLHWNDLVDADDLEKAFFVPPGQFPHPQYCSAMIQPFFHRLNFPGPADPSSFIILLGDAVHSFPPDLGQGVNSALQDVFVLRENLLLHSTNLSQALESFQNIQIPEAKAIAKLNVFAYPFAYGQRPFIDSYSRLKFKIRLFLSKVFPKLVTPPAYYQTINPNLKYSEILHNHYRSNKIIFSLFTTTLLFTAGIGWSFLSQWKRSEF